MLSSGAEQNYLGSADRKTGLERARRESVRERECGGKGESVDGEKAISSLIYSCARIVCCQVELEAAVTQLRFLPSAAGAGAGAGAEAVPRSRSDPIY